MLIIVDPIYMLLTLGVYRVILEAFMVIFRIHEETKTIREQGREPESDAKILPQADRPQPPPDCPQRILQACAG